MTKVIVSVSLDSNVLNKLNNEKVNRSDFINGLLKKRLFLKDELKEEIKELRKKLTEKEIELTNIEEKKKELIENASEELKKQMGHVQEILSRSGERYNELKKVWHKLTNKNLEIDLSFEEYEKLLEKYGEEYNPNESGKKY